MTIEEYIKLKREYFYKCKDILATEFDVDINDIEIITAKGDMCCILDRNNGRMFLFEKDLEDGTNCIIFKRYKKRCEK